MELQCRSVADVVSAVRSGRRLLPRGGGHCFVERPTDVVLDLSALRSITVAPDGIATVGAGALLGQVYRELHAVGRAIPAGCGPTVGIAGLTLGGGIGLVGRKYGLTCDRLVGAQVVLADGNVVECSEDRETDLFWALRGAGGGQFGVVTEFRFDTIAEPETTRIAATCEPDDVQNLVNRWQEWAPDAPDELTLNLTVDGSRVVFVGASLLPVGPTRELLAEFDVPFELRGGLPLSAVKESFAQSSDEPEPMRSEFFERTAEALEFGGRLGFTAMGGAYNRVPVGATAFAHRQQRFLLESATPQAGGSGRVYPNFPDLTLADGPAAYHGENLDRLRAVKRAYDPRRFFDFPQAV